MMRPTADIGHTTEVTEDPVRESAPGFGVDRADVLTAPELSLTEMVQDIRAGFGLEDLIDDAAVLHSLTYIVAGAQARERWVRAFSSPLGRALAANRRDLNTALGAILALLPAARN